MIRGLFVAVAVLASSPASAVTTPKDESAPYALVVRTSHLYCTFDQEVLRHFQAQRQYLYRPLDVSSYLLGRVVTTFPPRIGPDCFFIRQEAAG